MCYGRTGWSSFPSSGLLVLLVGIAALATAKESRIRVSTHDLEWKLGDSSGFYVFIDPPPNETVLVSLVASKGEDLLADSPGRHVIAPGSEGGLWLNLSARKAGYAVIHLNASLPDVDSSDAFVRISVLRLSWLNVLSAVFGWLYFIAWSVSFYPQIYLNWKRRSVVGLSFDFIGLNLTGFLAYSFFNLGVFFSPVVQSEYYARHPAGVLPVEVNDIVFGLHASLATFITVLQCYFYERKDQRMSMAARVLLGIVWVGGVLYGIITLAAGRHWSSPWLFYLYYFSYCKLVITLVKYIPQAILNFRRKSTIGWSIGNILLDFTGGTLSMLQMFIIAYNYDDWSSLFGNFTKFGLGLISIMFDVMFMMQHYVLYPNGNSALKKMPHDDL
ncbi:cystinosin homolog isoform X1 [Rhipicephalus sanguineus]|uniref:cystinosin homolog isoform X1 n=1 Tax=Rhipicephalus sanguineus TaxID=34632 RepID=UPI001895635A|nr:cystinosin homolog isoform X1 [Rhipicephalus sanguineus]